MADDPQEAAGGRSAATRLTNAQDPHRLHRNSLSRPRRRRMRPVSKFRMPSSKAVASKSWRFAGNAIRKRSGQPKPKAVVSMDVPGNVSARSASSPKQSRTERSRSQLLPSAPRPPSAAVACRATLLRRPECLGGGVATRLERTTAVVTRRRRIPTAASARTPAAECPPLRRDTLLLALLPQAERF
jgi:hypothetical protein